MKVSVVINPKAGSVNADMIENKISESLFRCDLRFRRTRSMEDMVHFLREQIEDKTDVVVVCGGDGSVNAALQILMKLREDYQFMPALCVVCSGTANDLAHEMGINLKIEQAVRNILEGAVKNIDVIEVTGDGEKKYMLTNGGIGIPALTADKANKVRSFLQRSLMATDKNKILKALARQTYKTVRGLGSGIYTLMLAKTLQEWDSSNWEVEISVPTKERFKTKAPFILVNNQPALGQSFVPAPFTNNADGHVNILVMDAQKIQDQVRQVFQASRGRELNDPRNKIYEVTDCEMKSAYNNLTFFGDGEILFRDVSQVQIKCHQRALPLVVSQAQG